MGQERDTERIIREFRLRQSRQFIAIGLTLFLLLLLALLYTRSDIFGVFELLTYLVPATSTLKDFHFDISHGFTPHDAIQA